MPISAADAIAPALEHTKRQLFRPFRFWQWIRLALVGLMAGEAGSGGCNLPHNLNPSQHPGPGLPGLGINPAALAAIIAVLIVGGLVFVIVFLYISSVMRFVLFDSVLARECHIGRGWARRQGEGLKYFLWQLGLTFATFAGLVILIGIPVAIALGQGWFRQPREHVVGLVLGGIVLFLVVILFVVFVAVIHVFTKDFVVPQMALDGIGPIEGWRRLWPMLQAEMGSYAAYVGMKIALAIAAAIVVGIAAVILGLLIAIPTVGLGIVAVITGKSAGLTWNAFTITIAVVVGCILVAAFMFLIAMISVPVIVFFPAYSIYFLAGRYRALNLALYPPTPPVPATSGPPPEPPPPPLMPEPDLLG